jgi:hypothetical protein
MFCEDPQCVPGAGKCKPLPKTQKSAQSPVCGCDEVTYWNDSVAASHGMSFGGLGPCVASAKSCAHSNDCPKDTHCHIFAFTCPPNGGGTCWALPDDCGKTSEKAEDCDQNCNLVCEMIRQDTPFKPAAVSCGG